MWAYQRVRNLSFSKNFADVPNKCSTKYTLEVLDLYNVSILSDAIFTAQKKKFSIKDFFSKCDKNPQETADLVSFTKKTLNGGRYFLCSVSWTPYYFKCGRFQIINI